MQSLQQQPCSFLICRVSMFVQYEYANSVHASERVSKDRWGTRQLTLYFEVSLAHRQNLKLAR